MLHLVLAHTFSSLKSKGDRQQSLCMYVEERNNPQGLFVTLSQGTILDGTLDQLFRGSTHQYTMHKASGYESGSMPPFLQLQV